MAEILYGAAGHRGRSVLQHVAEGYDKDCDLVWASGTLVVMVHLGNLDSALMPIVRPGLIGPAGATVLLNVTAVPNLELGLVPVVMTPIVQDLPLTQNNAIKNRVYSQ